MSKLRKRVSRLRNWYGVRLIRFFCGTIQPINPAQPIPKQGLVTLSLPEEVELLQGKQYQEVGQLEGRSNKLQGSYGCSITDHRCKVEWTIKGPTHATLELTVQAQRAGVLRRTIILENG